MKMIFNVALTLVLLALSQAAPLQNRIETDPELTAGFFEGDIILDNARNGHRNNSFHWPNNLVYYRIADGYFGEHL